MISAIIISLMLVAFFLGWRFGVVGLLLNVLVWVLTVAGSYFLMIHATMFSASLHLPAIGVIVVKYLVFVFSLIVLYWILRWVKKYVRALFKLPVLAQIDGLLGGILWLVGAYFIVYFSLTFILQKGTPDLVNQVHQSIIAGKILTLNVLKMISY